MQRRLMLYAIVCECARIFQVLGCKYNPLLIGRYALFILQFFLNG